jgi:hypothetical protein
VFDAASNQGVNCSQKSVQALLESSDISEDEPFAAMQRLGLQIIQPTLSGE